MLSLPQMESPRLDWADTREVAQRRQARVARRGRARRALRRFVAGNTTRSAVTCEPLSV